MSIEKSDFLEITKPLNDTQFRYLIITLMNQSYRRCRKHTPTLFDAIDSERANCYRISKEIDKIIPIDDIEHIIDCFNDLVMDSTAHRERLQIEEYTFTDKPENTDVV